MSLLTVRNMSKRFGGLTAVDNVSLSINRGEIYGLIGPNGAGKTTCFNLITGLYPADSGEFSIADKPYYPKQIEKVTAVGIARTFQNVRLFNEMSVLENVMVGRHVRTRNGLWAALSRHKPVSRHGTGWSTPVSPNMPTIAPATLPTAINDDLRLPVRWQPTRCCWRLTNRPPG